MAFQGIKISGEGVPEVSPEETERVGVREAAEGVELIDVRRPDEYVGELGHVPGAKLVTLETDFMKWVATAPKDKTYVFICRSGMRSGRATLFARSNGIANTYNMEGGMLEWNARGLKTTR